MDGSSVSGLVISLVLLAAFLIGIVFFVQETNLKRKHKVSSIALGLAGVFLVFYLIACIQQNDLTSYFTFLFGFFFTSGLVLIVLAFMMWGLTWVKRENKKARKAWWICMAIGAGLALIGFVCTQLFLVH